jgi:hypothetical protein
MIPPVGLSHVTLLVPSLEASRARLPADLYRLWNIDTFDEKVDGESREFYVGPADYAKGMLLFVQGTTSRWFANFAARFGYGLHHVAIDVPNVVEYCERMNETGWYLHVGSAYALQKLKCVYLLRPNFPVIIEVQHQEEPVERGYFVEEIVVGVNNESDKEAVEALGIAEFKAELNAQTRFKIGNEEWLVDDLVKMG